MEKSLLKSVLASQGKIKLHEQSQYADYGDEAYIPWAEAYGSDQINTEMFVSVQEIQNMTAAGSVGDSTVYSFAGNSAAGVIDLCQETGMCFLDGAISPTMTSWAATCPDTPARCVFTTNGSANLSNYDNWLNSEGNGSCININSNPNNPTGFYGWSPTMFQGNMDKSINELAELCGCTVEDLLYADTLAIAPNASDADNYAGNYTGPCDLSLISDQGGNQWEQPNHIDNNAGGPIRCSYSNEGVIDVDVDTDDDDTDDDTDFDTEITGSDTDFDTEVTGSACSDFNNLVAGGEVTAEEICQSYTSALAGSMDGYPLPPEVLEELSILTDNGNCCPEDPIPTDPCNLYNSVPQDQQEAVCNYYFNNLEGDDGGLNIETHAQIAIIVNNGACCPVEPEDRHDCSAQGACVPNPDGEFESLSVCEDSGCSPENVDICETYYDVLDAEIQAAICGPDACLNPENEGLDMPICDCCPDDTGGDDDDDDDDDGDTSNCPALANAFGSIEAFCDTCAPPYGTGYGQQPECSECCGGDDEECPDPSLLTDEWVDTNFNEAANVGFNVQEYCMWCDGTIGQFLTNTNDELCPCCNVDPDGDIDDDDDDGSGKYKCLAGYGSAAGSGICAETPDGDFTTLEDCLNSGCEEPTDDSACSTEFLAASLTVQQQCCHYLEFGAPFTAGGFNQSSPEWGAFMDTSMGSRFPCQGPYSVSPQCCNEIQPITPGADSSQGQDVQKLSINTPGAPQPKDYKGGGTDPQYLKDKEEFLKKSQARPLRESIKSRLQTLAGIKNKK